VALLVVAVHLPVEEGPLVVVFVGLEVVVLPEQPKVVLRSEDIYP
jgi:hypothetical protein